MGINIETACVMDNVRSGLPLRGAAVAILLVLVAGCSTSLPHASQASPIPISVAPAASAGASGFDPAHVAEVLAPAVGEIIVNTSGGIATGSGFVIQAGGGTSYLMTNNHVVQGARKVQVLMLDGRHFTATVVGTDPIEDLAVVKVSDTLPVAQFGDSTRLRVGQPVVAIGSPLGQEGSVTAGILSALHRTISAGGGQGQASETLPEVLQTDAPINPGNSGGPLADGNGQVIGVNTAASNGANSIGFAIPSSIARRIGQALIDGKKPGHPYLGVAFDTLEVALEKGKNVEGFGVVVGCTVPGLPAAKAGLKAGDLIEKFDGISLNNGQSLAGVLQLHNPGDTVKLTVVRGGSTQELTATLADRPTQPQNC